MDTRRTRRWVHPQCRGAGRFRPRLEALEGRTLLSAGALDPAFGMGGEVVDARGSAAHAVAVQADNKILVAGDGPLTRYNADGTPDATFGTGGQVAVPFQAYAVTVQADGKILVGGTTRTVPANSTFALARYNTDGSPDASFGTGGLVTTSFDTTVGAVVYALAVAPGGKIVAAGSASTLSGLGEEFGVARYNADGSLDSAFAAGGKEILVAPDFGFDSRPPVRRFPLDEAHGLAVYSDGRIVLAGTAGFQYDTAPQYRHFALARLLPDGSTDPSFGSGGWVGTDFGGDVEGAAAVALLPDGHLLAAGTQGVFYPYVPYVYNRSGVGLARYNADGSPDPSFGLGGKVATDFGGQLDSAAGLAVQADGKIVVAGTHADDTTASEFALARFFADGSPDTRFAGGGVGGAAFGNPVNQAFAVAEQPDGNFVEVGSTGQQSAGSYALARFLGGSDALAGGPNQRFVEQAYLDLLGRPAEAAGLAYWAGALDAGTASRVGVALGIEYSQEGRTVLVQTLYQRYLQRPAEPAAVTTWVGYLFAGHSDEELAARLLGSTEYFQVHTVGGAPDDRFLQAVYLDVLGRLPDAAGQQQWGAALAGGAARADVALAVLDSQAGRADLVGGQYHEFLHRTADAAGLGFYVGLLNQGWRAEDVAASLVGSQEYFLGAQT